MMSEKSRQTGIPNAALTFIFLEYMAVYFTLKNFFKFFKKTSCTEHRDMVSYTPVFTTQGFASLTQLVECHLAKVVVEGSSPLARSIS